MTEWKLIRNSDNYVSFIYYQETQPEFNHSFGNEADFHFESRILSEEEDAARIQEDRREVYPPYFQLVEALHAKENGVTLLYSAFIEEVQTVYDQLPIITAATVITDIQSDVTFPSIPSEPTMPSFPSL